MDDASSVTAIRDLAILSVGATTVGEMPVVVLPAEHTIVDLEHLLGAPLRKKGNVAFNDLPSFAWYVNAHCEPGTVVYLSRDKDTVFTAVLDEHESNIPNGTSAGWRQHRATLKLVHSRQWSAWSSLTKRNQQDFATFLEDRVQEVVTPDGAALFELVTTLEASQNASFSSATKLHNGDVRLTWNKETKAGNGTMEVPQKLQLFIPIWENGPKQAVDVKLRFELLVGAVSFKLEIERFDDVVDAAIDEAIGFIREKTSKPVLLGKIVS